MVFKTPQVHSANLSKFKTKKNAQLEDSREESTNWCKQHCVSQQKALCTITGKKTLEPLHELYPKEITEAQYKVSDCPVNMGGEGAISFLYHLVIEKKFQKIIETGVFYCWFSLAILLAIEDSENAFLISNDMPYIRMNNDDYVGCVIPENLKYKWQLQCLPDVKGISLALKKLNNNKIR